ncbi:hypothetical protein CesoFtcFv8_025192 [Champsocephalus esox]|uniref:Uncharacterized protein n=1 Tax=Champsocephalus esox TaxID=159716 RepID=A0AAN8B412_9TELE|nr:hypothetical protein CesoFtcFv8_025192 [Champsocephalus esox]
MRASATTPTVMVPASDEPEDSRQDHLNPLINHKVPRHLGQTLAVAEHQPCNAMVINLERYSAREVHPRRCYRNTPDGGPERNLHDLAPDRPYRSLGEGVN